jgi:DNA-binding transcriptional MerR regulator
MYKISEFSKLTMLTVKALRYYDDEKILVPSYRNEENWYRYYDEENLKKAELIRLLRELDFSIGEIKEIIENCEDKKDLSCFLQEKKKLITNKIFEHKNVIKKIDTYISYSEKVNEVKKVNQEILIKEIDSVLMASIRYNGKYNEVGKYIGKIYSEVKSKAKGAPFNLYYDGEYKEEADIEICVPISEKIVSKKINIRQLSKIKAVSIMHYGSYDNFNLSYKLLFDYIQENNLNIYTPTREVYIKGPGMIFKGNSDKYVTEILIPIK